MHIHTVARVTFRVAFFLRFSGRVFFCIWIFLIQFSHFQKFHSLIFLISHFQKFPRSNLSLFNFHLQFSHFQIFRSASYLHIPPPNFNSSIFSLSAFIRSSKAVYSWLPAIASASFRTGTNILKRYAILCQPKLTGKHFCVNSKLQLALGPESSSSLGSAKRRFPTQFNANRRRQNSVRISLVRLQVGGCYRVAKVPTTGRCSPRLGSALTDGRSTWNRIAVGSV
jgi:hypothetical protein